MQMKQNFLSVPLLKTNTNGQLQVIKTALNEVAATYAVIVNYVTDRKNGWFKAEVEGEAANVIQFLLHVSSCMRG